MHWHRCRHRDRRRVNTSRWASLIPLSTAIDVSTGPIRTIHLGQKPEEEKTKYKNVKRTLTLLPQVSTQKKTKRSHQPKLEKSFKRRLQFHAETKNKHLEHKPTQFNTPFPLFSSTKAHASQTPPPQSNYDQNRKKNQMKTN